MQLPIAHSLASLYPGLKQAPIPDPEATAQCSFKECYSSGRVVHLLMMLMSSAFLLPIADPAILRAAVRARVQRTPKCRREPGGNAAPHGAQQVANQAP